jgi:hypothetical protein
MSGLSIASWITIAVILVVLLLVLYAVTRRPLEHYSNQTSMINNHRIGRRGGGTKVKPIPVPFWEQN